MYMYKYSLLLTCIVELNMADLNKFVVPRINVVWEDVAHALLYKLPEVQYIEMKHNQEPKRCCKELFKNWLSTNNGVQPKNWSTLLEKLSDIPELATAREEIIMDLRKIKLHTDNS